MNEIALATATLLVHARGMIHHQSSKNRWVCVEQNTHAISRSEPATIPTAAIAPMDMLLVLGLLSADEEVSRTYLQAQLIARIRMNSLPPLIQAFYSTDIGEIYET